MNYHHSFGYTLIEVLVAASIILLLAGGGIAAFTRFNQKQKVLTAAKELQSYLRTAQTLSRVGERPASCNELNGYVVQTVSDGSVKQVRLLARCINDDILSRSYNLPTGVSLTADIEMTFLVLHGGVNGAGTIQVTNGDNLTYQFAVTPGGEITSGGFL